ncbi:MAG: hypothetical protein AB7J35_18885 [Dehalococcoidia bacterium]
MSNDRNAEFWNLAAPHLAAGRCDEGTMMGNPCLRVKGNFVAMHWSKGGGMIVKLDQPSVLRHIEAGHGAAFSPNGRVFKEWLAVPESDTARWEPILAEAINLAAARK